MEWDNFKAFVIALIKGVLTSLSIFFFVALLLSLITQLYHSAIRLNEVLVVADAYVRLILSSWPATILILGILLLTRHKAAVDHFIRHRMTGIGIDGVKAEVQATAATEGEIKTKNIEDSKDEQQLVPPVGNAADVVVEGGVSKPIPNTLKADVFESYKKRAAVEDRVQTVLISHFGPLYQPHVKVSLGREAKGVVLDGLLTSYSGGRRAVEIRYVTNKQNLTALSFSLDRAQRRLAEMGIPKFIVIIVADDLTTAEAEAISSSLRLRATRHFFSLSTATGQLDEVVLPKKKALLN